MIPELETPSHAYGWAGGHPELVLCPNVQPNYGDYGGPASGHLDLLNPNTERLIQGLLTEWSAWFPDRFVHLGTDEVVDRCYLEHPPTRDYLEAHHMSVDDLVARHVENITRSAVTKLGKKTLFWDESVLVYGAKLNPKHTVIQTWRWESLIRDVINLGYDTVASPYTAYYLDLGQGDWINKPGGGEGYAFSTWSSLFDLDQLIFPGRGYTRIIR